jgi:hypothetical protein
MDEMSFFAEDLQNFDTLLVNQSGLFYLYHPSIIKNELNRCCMSNDKYAHFKISSIDAEPIDSVIAKTLIGD